ncbi:MAG: hypothetical protein QOI24_557 [Acidobacteriota bacterium]|jgi:DUF4097 and DUF4098 domain-containing protein YvlB|nr:hypothetical protein [Acidobacteriota bacterium]
MNSRNRTIYSLAVAMILIGGCAKRERYATTITRTWPAAAIHRLEIREVDGTVTVDGSPTDTVSLTANVRARGIAPKKNEENEGYFRTELSGDTLSIGRRDKGHVVVIGFPFMKSRDVTVDYVVHVPQSVALEVRTVNGRIATKGVDGETQLTTVNGPIDVETQGSSELSAKTVNGRVIARFLHDFQGARLKTVNGEVRAVLPASASFSGDFTQVNGDFEASFPMNIHSNPGSRRVSGQVNGGRYELKISTVNGDIQVENGPVPPVPPAAPAAPVAPTAPAAPAAPATPASPVT